MRGAIQLPLRLFATLPLLAFLAGQLRQRALGGGDGFVGSSHLALLGGALGLLLVQVGFCPFHLLRQLTQLAFTGQDRLIAAVAVITASDRTARTNNFAIQGDNRWALLIPIIVQRPSRRR